VEKNNSRCILNKIDTLLKKDREEEKKRKEKRKKRKAKKRNVHLFGKSSGGESGVPLFRIFRIESVFLCVIF
jgi:hypothetical protein